MHGERQGSGHIVGAARSLLVPHQLPLSPVRFTNRRGELSMLDSCVRARGETPNVVVLRGPGGVGKSALAVRWLSSVHQRYSDGQLYAELAQADGAPVAVEDVLGVFLRSLGVPGDRVPEGLAERVGLYRTVTAERSLAILLDDVISAAQVKSLLPSSGTSVIVVTTKRPLPALIAEGASAVDVRPMDQAAALELLETSVGAERVATDRTAALDLVRLCSGLPIAVRVVAALMVLRPRWRVADLVDMLRDEQRRLEVLAVDDLSVRATFDVSYWDLSSDAARAYQVLGVHPGSLVCADMVATACQTTRPQARAMLDDLVDAGLLDEVGDDLYQCHDLVHAHARAVAASELDPATRGELSRGILEWHLAVVQATSSVVLPARRVVRYEFGRPVAMPDGLTDRPVALEWLERHRHDVAAAIRSGHDWGWHELAYALGDALQPLFILHKHFGEAAEVNAQSLQSALEMGDADAATNMRKRLARVYVRLDRLELAQQHIDELLRVSRQRGDRRGIVSGLKSLAILHSRRGRHDDAVDAFAEAARLARELHALRTEGLARVDLGHSLLAANRSREAVEELARARALLSSLDTPDDFNAARATMLLALAHLRVGDTQAAVQFIQTALLAVEQTGANTELARAHEIAVEIYTTAGERDRARDHQRRANDIDAEGSARPAADEPAS